MAVKAQIRGAATSRELIAAVKDCATGLRAAFPQALGFFYRCLRRRGVNELGSSGYAVTILPIVRMSCTA